MTFDTTRYEKSDAETATVVHDEARQVLDRQDARIVQVETKASWLLGATGVLLTAVVTALPIWLDRGSPAGVEVAVAVLAFGGLFASAVLALLALQSKRYPATDYEWLMGLTSHETLELRSQAVRATLAADSFDKAQATSEHAAAKARLYRWSLWAHALALASLAIIGFGSIIDYIRT